MDENTKVDEIQQINTEEGTKLDVISVSVDAEDRRKRAGTIFSFIWTIISIIYTIAMTAYLMSMHWVNDQFTIVLSIILAFFIVIVLVLVGLFFTDLDRIKTHDKTLKAVGFLIRLFKAALNITFVAITAISVAGIAYDGFSMDAVKEWAVVIATMFVAVVKLFLVVFNFVAPKVIRHKFSKGTYYKTTYIDGQKQAKKHKTRNKLMKKLNEWSLKQ